MRNNIHFPNTLALPECRGAVLAIVFLLTTVSVEAIPIAAVLAGDGPAGIEREPFPVRQFSIGHRRLAHTDAQLNYKLAGVAARMRLYPLAMRLFLHTLVGHKAKTADGPDFADYNSAEFSLTGERELSAVQQEVLRANLLPRDVKISPKSKPETILRQLQQDSAAARYAILIQVKQPEHGKRRIFKGLGNVGHTFITLIRYNSDNSLSGCSFGLYPKKNYPLAGSPFFPVTPPLFRDDSKHDWDELVGKFISKRRFIAICNALIAYEARRYNLNSNNCTDFALAIGTLCGISFSDTHGSWPFGGNGDNPACLGQSILAGKFTDTDTQSKENLFVQINHENIF